MAPREDIVSSAVSFLQDPSVATAPLEKRLEFLRSKNLTQEEIDLSLARAAGDASAPPATSQNSPYYPPSSQQLRGPPGSYQYNQYGAWQPPPPPEPPRRDWRDWFIMATVVGGASYGLYVLADRYIKPLIAPPTPPQLEQDKAAIDEQFNKAFALLDTLSSDTAALKEAEEARTQKLDTAINDIESIIADLKAANTRREDDSRRMEADIKSMKESLPKSIDSVRDASERQLKELSSELGSLKLLMGNRMGSGSSSFGSGGQGIPRTQPGQLPTSSSTAATPSTESAPSSNPPRSTSSFSTPASQFSSSTTVPAATTQSRPGPGPSYGSSSGKAAIPAWQMAASNKAKETPAAPNPFSNSATNGTQQQDGADAVAALNAS
ncbi:peroxisomal membrane protein pex14 [Elasticomyces elasticus]|uniref:Peroxisomal membrane protein PEX14 n=1 Tax=Exophiala sideris TaxID=1016849 RepID=A0ABR0IWU0_9EURO|nr:peroxisomal membrane protein pex14 [Elasticomyces elasticus]KAK5021914.1 peroxisomal membrane protein pex14 [Exophiala sideris]KAK5025977.1 peroxisomal membrane protein pex14 [Exophiala sideris]KAK5050664.1 peroxisomal membrane protein pex14 [Exophiala sideris]KAK5177149.1 peroxisomal membrane protein pex14 [Eurotiomycetes sp. CCFEE 6388]